MDCTRVAGKAVYEAGDLTKNGTVSKGTAAGKAAGGAAAAPGVPP
jgi:hypothetical protein